MSRGPDLAIETSCNGVVAGIDEAGRGPWAGPVVAAAVIVNPAHPITGINDSKALSPEKRARLFDAINMHYICGVGIAEVGEIDSVNILQATYLAMQRAVQQLPLRPELALVDGNRAPALPCATQTIVQGDALSLSIAAASIIAKVTRDRLMHTLAKEYAGYGWERNSGYGTSEHQDALARLGVTPHHRRSFSPIRALLEAA